MIKMFYLIFGVALYIGGAFLVYRRTQGLDGDTTTFAIALCGIVGTLCFVMYKYIDKLTDDSGYEEEEEETEVEKEA